jgi:hypothetical protein
VNTLSCLLARFGRGGLGGGLCRALLGLGLILSLAPGLLLHAATVAEAATEAASGLSVTMSASPSPVIAGTPLTYTISITNNWKGIVLCGYTGWPPHQACWYPPSATATGLTVSETLPTGPVFKVTNTGGFSCSIAGLDVMCTNGSVAPGHPVTISIAASAPLLGCPGEFCGGPPNALTITNTASVNPGGLTASTATLVVPPPLGAYLTCNPTSVKLLQGAQCFASITNGGNIPLSYNSTRFGAGSYLGIGAALDNVWGTTCTNGSAGGGFYLDCAGGTLAPGSTANFEFDFHYYAMPSTAPTFPITDSVVFYLMTPYPEREPYSITVSGP